MEIQFENLGKRFGRQWIFRKIDFEVKSNETLAIIGPNGGGKSTLLKIVSTYIDPTEGSISYFQNQDELPFDQIPAHIGMAAPYMNVIEELTLKEHLDFHFTFKSPTISPEEMCEKAGLLEAMYKYVQDFSSGMKQRLKLLMAFYTQNQLILLDEPTSNLDEKGVQWYLDEINNLKGEKTIIIASNQRYEYDFADKFLDVSDYKS